MNIKLLDEKEIDLMKEVLEDDNMSFNTNNLRKFVNDNHSFGFIAKEDKKILGFAYAYSLLRPDGKNMFYLHSVGLLPQYQNKGVGTKLLQFIIKYAKENNYSEVFVITDKGNPRACHVYEKVGFKNDIENEIVYVCDFEEEIQWKNQ